MTKMDEQSASESRTTVESIFFNFTATDVNSTAIQVDNDDSSVQLCSEIDLFNVTRTAPIEYAKVMYGVMMPGLVAVTLVANLLIVAVLNKRHMKTPTNLVLLWMAVADLLTLLWPFPWYLYM